MLLIANYVWMIFTFCSVLVKITILKFYFLQSSEAEPPLPAIPSTNGAPGIQDLLDTHAEQNSELAEVLASYKKLEEETNLAKERVSWAEKPWHSVFI